MNLPAVIPPTADVIDFRAGMQRLRPAHVARQTAARLHNRPILDRMAARQKDTTE